MALDQFRLEIKQVDMTRRTAHEKLNYSLGFGRVVQADWLTRCLRGSKGTVAPEHPGQRDAAQPAAGAPEKITSAMRLAKRLV